MTDDNLDKEFVDACRRLREESAAKIKAQNNSQEYSAAWLRFIERVAEKPEDKFKKFQKERPITAAIADRLAWATGGKAEEIGPKLDVARKVGFMGALGLLALHVYAQSFVKDSEVPKLFKGLPLSKDLAVGWSIVVGVSVAEAAYRGTRYVSRKWNEIVSNENKAERGWADNEPKVVELS